MKAKKLICFDWLRFGIFVFFDGFGELIGAGSVVAATNPRKQGFHFVDIFAFHKARDSLQIAAATADETYVMQFVVLGYVE